MLTALFIVMKQASGTHRNIKLNKCLTVRAMHAKFGDSLENCIEECVRRTMCKSLNYKRKTFLCELFSTNFGISEPLITSSDCMYLDVRDGDLLLIQTNSPCSTNVCKERERCNAPNAQNCLITECPDLEQEIEHGQLFGNMNNVGNARVTVCDEGYAIFGSSRVKCTAYGNWTQSAVCEITCSMPPTVQNGHVTAAEIRTPYTVFVSSDPSLVFSQTDYLNSSWIEYSCENTTVMQGSNITQCLNGNWTAFPKCVTPGLGQLCSNNSECVVPKSVCRGGSCKCLSEHSYSYSSKSCVYDCNTFADTFQSEVGKKLNYLDDESHYMYNYTACKQRCLEITSFTCQSFEVSSSLCLISQNNANDGYYRDAPDYVYYQRDCLT